MRASNPAAVVVDYHQVNAADSLLPKPSILSSSGWSEIHLEVFQQPKFETAEHYHPMHIIACGMANSLGHSTGAGARWLDGKRQQEPRNVGDIAVIPAGITHRCSWDTPVQFVILAIEPVLLQWVGQDWVNPDRIELIPRFATEPDGLIQSIIFALKTEVEMGGIGSHLLIDSLRTTLIIHLLRYYCATQPKLNRYSNGFSQSKLRQVKDYIREHLHQNLKLSEIAAIAQLSPYHFLRLFKQSTSHTPHQYILQCRVERAKFLLQHSELTIAEIAVRVGFSDQSHFTRYFKGRVGVTPRQFQRRSQ
ncbi:MAG: helix-turn-helix transcriptional regulator [Leptolyngbyaceae cyanobacterium SL_5_9]|nr:helix-turn-helix transcriptional regulator [Leptolyngbyaceae cyanobacterium SL_5_9]NJO73297.1 helix-turn-helix transcriptional regulator [Leptolyngbyaceae cyanobacterium RM1_406_9]